MRLIAIKNSRDSRHDTLRCVRRDGSETTAKMPRQGVLPHDLIHYVVENALRFEHGFLGMVAKGADISFAMATAHETGASIASNQAPQAESLVESLQAQMWAGCFDEAQFHEGVQGACSMRGCPVPDLSALERGPAQLHDQVIRLGQQWAQVPFHGEMTLQLEHL